MLFAVKLIKELEFVSSKALSKMIASFWLAILLDFTLREIEELLLSFIFPLVDFPASSQ